MIEEATEALAETAAAALPLRPPEDPHRFPGFTLPTLGLDFGDPALATFAAAAEADEQLSVIWRSGDPGLGVSASNGSFWRLPQAALGLTIIRNATQRIVFSGTNVDDPERLKEAVRQAVADLRVVLIQGELDAVSITAFSGIEVPGAARIETPWGTLRPAGVVEQGIRPFSQDTPTVVVETPFRVGFRLGEPDDGMWDHELVSVLSRLALLLPLSLLLGVEREDHYVSCSWLWQTAVIPAQIGSAMAGPRGRSESWLRRRFAQPIALGDRDIAYGQEWMRRVSDAYDPAVAIAVRRTMSAVAERVDPEDALIDAVIACESLFGHGAESEVTFRVTSAIALLLENDPTRRAAHRRELGKIYGDRSKVVHGGVVSPEQLNNSKETAIRTAVECLRCLFRDHPHLIADQERGIRLILRAEAK